ncbi:hypothetical protein K3495_g8602 [Podosphaera aphanis]|nr:hypothetical protein K3495_g8602 [Podosphaera aphanis]
MADKSVNDLIGPNSLIPTLHVFGTFPRMCHLEPPSPSISQRANAIRKAMDETNKLRAWRQVADPLGQRNGPSTSSIHSLTLGSNVLVRREGQTSRSGLWTCPYELPGTENETFVIKLLNGPTKFRSTVVKPYYDSNTANANNDTNNHNDINGINDSNEINDIKDIKDSNESNDNIHPTTNENIEHPARRLHSPYPLRNINQQ